MQPHLPLCLFVFGTTGRGAPNFRGRLAIGSEDGAAALLAIIEKSSLVQDRAEDSMNMICTLCHLQFWGLHAVQRPFAATQARLRASRIQRVAKSLDHHLLQLVKY